MAFRWEIEMLMKIGSKPTKTHLIKNASSNLAPACGADPGGMSYVVGELPTCKECLALMGLGTKPRQ